MNTGIRKSARALALSILAAVGLAAAPAAAQMESVDPDLVIDGDLIHGTTPPPPPAVPPAPDASYPGNGTPMGEQANGSVDGWSAEDVGTATGAPGAQDSSTTYHKDDLIGAAEGVFGTGAEGLASLIEGLLRDQGEPNGYIVGREGGGAIGFGLRYGSGTLHHKVEGNRPVYWTGPSLGLDLGFNAGNAFVLVYNLYDTQQLFHRYGAGEGQAYLVGGFHISYLRRDDIVLIPVRMGAGLRLGANVGYMKFSEEQRWLPF